MSVSEVAQKYVDGGFKELNGLGIHDAVHVLATQQQLNKGDLRAAIIAAYASEIAEPPADLEIYVEAESIFDE